MPGALAHVWRNPAACARWLTHVLRADGMTVSLVYRDPVMVIFDVLIEAPPPELPGYPAEHVRVNINRAGEIWAVPVGGDQRRWCHRYPYLTPAQMRHQADEDLTWVRITGPLCLEYPLDPPHLRWQWSDGLDVYLRIVQRHLWSEEYWRRHGDWPAEAAPHGARPDGSAHPVLSYKLRSA